MTTTGRRSCSRTAGQSKLIYWTLVTDILLLRGFRVVAYDLCGHGHSEPACGGDYSLARFGEDLESVLATVCRDAERPLVAGHSLGAMSIVAWAERHDVERRVCAAALLNTGVGGLVAEGLLIPVPRLARALGRTPLARGALASQGQVPGFSTPVSHALIRYAAFGPAATPALWPSTSGCSRPARRTCARRSGSP